MWETDWKKNGEKKKDCHVQIEKDKQRCLKEQRL